MTVRYSLNDSDIREHAAPHFGGRLAGLGGVRARSRSLAGGKTAGNLCGAEKLHGASVQLARCGLVDGLGVANAPDLKRAEARLREADATAQQSGASLLPKLTANGSASETRASLNQGFPAQFQSFLPHGFHDQGRVTGDLSYDLDLFGILRLQFHDHGIYSGSYPVSVFFRY